MATSPTIPLFLDNRKGQMIVRDSTRFFDGEYDSEEIGTWDDALLQLRLKNGTGLFFCGCCKKQIKIAGSPHPGPSEQRFHFRHLSDENINECEFHEGVHFSARDIERMKFNGQKESSEHITLKNLVAQLFEPKVGSDNVKIEQVITKIDRSWRKPDVHVIFPGKTVAFEIQLSTTFLSTIQDRNAAYRNSGWYIVWIFKDFVKAEDDRGENLQNVWLTKLDIFAANNFNAFVLDREAAEKSLSSGNLWLKVYYRDFEVRNINGKYIVEPLLRNVFIEFDKLTFREDDHLVFYYDSLNKKEKCQAIAKYKNALEEQKNEAVDIIYSNGRFVNSGELYNLLKECPDFYNQLEEAIEIWIHSRELKMDKMLCRDLCYELTPFYNELSEDCPYKVSVYHLLNHLWRLAISNLMSDGPMVHVSRYLSFEDFSETCIWDLILSQRYCLLSVEKKEIQKWIMNYNTISDKKKYNHRYVCSWIVLFNEKIRDLHKDDSRKELQTLMKNNWRFLRAIVSFRIGVITGFDFNNMSQIAAYVIDKFPQFISLSLRYAQNLEIKNPGIFKSKKGVNHLESMRMALHRTPQDHSLDYLVEIIFAPSK